MRAAFADPVLDAQGAFRALLHAMSHPGRVVALDAAPDAPAPLMPAAAAALLTLADAETPVWTDAAGEALDWLRFHTGAPFVADPRDAAFLLATGAPPALDALDAGTDEAPQEGATLIAQLPALAEGRGWRLTGPGVEHEHRLAAEGLPPGFAAQWAANAARFPRGVDVILCAGPRLAALPRTTRLAEG
ncbi:MAG: phosphonate C-P lyase system protein PhnH [Acetobacteraceae bacterium]|nr:phosphonate C-P lyase system protein PhnH [Acetobacteraceae bacterium]